MSFHIAFAMTFVALLLQGCDKETEPTSGLGLGDVENNTTVKQIDMTVMVPIHPSSLKYFDYCITYTDNTETEST